MSRSRIYRRSDSKYWWAEFTTPDGAPDRRSTGCTDARKAQDWLAARTLERQRAEAGIPQARRVPADYALAEYITLRAPHWSDGWRRTVEAFFRHDIIPHFQRLSTADITRAEVEKFRNGMIGRPTRHKNPKPISNATINRIMACLAAFGEWCREEGRGYLLSNPFADHAPLPEDESPPPSLTEAQLAAWLDALPDNSRARGRPPCRAIVTFAVESGMRKGELGRLRWEDVDLDTRVVWVVSIRRRGFTKARHTRPQILTDRAIQALRSLPRRLDGFVFGPIPDLSKSMQAAARKVGIGDVWFHACRHFGASRLGALGASDADLQAWGGWSSPRMVKRYDHSRLNRLKALAGRLEGAPQNFARSSHAAGPGSIEGGQRDANHPQSLPISWTRPGSNR